MNTNHPLYEPQVLRTIYNYMDYKIHKRLQFAEQIEDMKIYIPENILQEESDLPLLEYLSQERPEVVELYSDIVGIDYMELIDAYRNTRDFKYFTILNKLLDKSYDDIDQETLLSLLEIYLTDPDSNTIFNSIKWYINRYSGMENDDILIKLLDMISKKRLVNDIYSIVDDLLGSGISVYPPTTDDEQIIFLLQYHCIVPYD